LNKILFLWFFPNMNFGLQSLPNKTEVAGMNPHMIINSELQIINHSISSENTFLDSNSCHGSLLFRVQHFAFSLSGPIIKISSVHKKILYINKKQLKRSIITFILFVHISHAVN
jgi:hypothetical protein